MGRKVTDEPKKRAWSGCRIFKPKQGWQGARAGLVDPGYLAGRVWPNADYGRAFAYLFRRFGMTPPFDWHKQLCNYDLTTPDKEVAFWVGCSPSSIGMEPGYWVTDAVAKAMWPERKARWDWPLANPELGETYSDRIPPEGTACRRVIDAIEAGMRDLLRPVYIRDMPVNLLGPLTDEQARSLKAAEHAWRERD